MNINNKDKAKKYKNEILNNKIASFIKQRNKNHERNLTNILINHNNYEANNFLNELEDLKERENKMNYLKNEINNNKLIPNLRNKSEKVKKSTYLSDPNLDIDNANNKQNKKTTNNYIKKNRNFNYNDFTNTSPIIKQSKEIININNNNFNDKTDSNNFLNDQKVNNIQNIDNESNNISSEMKEKVDININKKIGYIKNVKNINLAQKNYTLDNNSKTNLDIINELKAENVTLKSKNRILKESLDNKEKIIQALNNKINEMENSKNFNNNQDENQISDLKLRNDILLKQNKELILGIESLNEKIKEINIMIQKKNKKYNNQIYTYKSKLSEYKRKIILLKRRVDELYNKNTNETEHTSNNIYNKIRDRKHLRSQYNFLNKNKIQISTEKKELFDDMEKYSHHRYNTFINDYNNYFNNI